jgi:hypothetical protein
VLMNALKAQESVRQSFELSAADRRYLDFTKALRTPKGAVEVEVPQEEEDTRVGPSSQYQAMTAWPASWKAVRLSFRITDSAANARLAGLSTSRRASLSRHRSRPRVR